jgi:hypothetical protein
MSGNRFRIPILLCLLVLLHVSAEPSTILSRSPAKWTPAENSAPAVSDDAALLFPCSFNASTERQVWDADLDFDAAAADGLLLDLEFQPAERIRALTVYIRSGKGWYASTVTSRPGRHRVWLPFSRFETLDSPSAWKEASHIRLSPWKGGEGEASLRLYSLQARVAHLAILRPSESSVPDASERAYAQSLATQLGAFFSELSLPAVEISDDENVDLSRYKLLVLPLNSHPSAALLRRLERALRRGGKLMVFYNGNKELAALAGVDAQPWLPAGSPGRWMSMTFPEDLWGSAFRAYQRETPQLLPARPGKNARVAAWWENRDGARQPEAALLLSPRAAWFTAPFHPEDENAKQRMLAFTVDALVPGLAAPAHAERLRRLREDPLTASDERMPRLETLLGEKKSAELWDLSENIRRDSWLRASSRPLPPGIMRGVWDHRGDGLHAGRWDLTAAELAGAGFSDLFLFVSRRAEVPKTAVTATAAKGIALHAWHVCWNLYDAPAAERERLQRLGRLQISSAGTVTPWLCPSHETNRRMELERLLRLAGTPGLRGLHLDYIRFPDADHCFCPSCRRAFELEHGKALDEWPAAVLAPGALREDFLRWRAGGIRDFVRDLSVELRRSHPDLLLSAAVWPGYPEIINRLGQDWPPWLREGWIDFAVPMSYSTRASEVADWTRAHRLAVGEGKRIITGIGVTAAESRLTPPLVLEQIHAAREAGADGFVLFDLNQTLRQEMFPLMQRLQQGESHD